jgi:hypothetical protein
MLRSLEDKLENYNQMKKTLYTLLLIVFCFLSSSGQKQYRAKVFMLDKKVVTGLLFHVNDEGVYILPRKVRWDVKNPENNKPNVKFLDYRLIKRIHVRREGSVGLGIVLGLGTSIVVGNVVGNNQKNSLTGLGVAIAILPVGPFVGGVVGSNSKKFDMKRDSTALSAIKIRLKKYEFYHQD